MKSEEAYSILDIVSESEGQGVVLTRSGSICVSFELREPDVICKFSCAFF